MNTASLENQSETESPTKSLLINEIFFSIQGETTTSGIPTLFIRLTGCPLRCHYCDTEYAFHDGNKKTIEEILKEVETYQTQHITVTGGEPLAQKNVLVLLKELNNRFYDVSLETSGAKDISSVDPRTRIILDVKTPGSGETGKNLLNNLKTLGDNDEIKFVITDHTDYIWANNFILANGLESRIIHYSPAYGTLSPTDLAEWMIQDKPPARLQLQLHKILWGDVPGK